MTQFLMNHHHSVFDNIDEKKTINVVSVLDEASTLDKIKRKINSKGHTASSEAFKVERQMEIKKS